MHVERTSAPTSSAMVVRGCGEYLLMRLSCSLTGRITQSAADGWAQASLTRTSPYLWRGGVSRARSDQQMQFSCATAIGDDDDIMWKWAKWWRQHREKQKETEWDLKVEPPVRCHFLKATCLSAAKQRDNMLIYSNKNHMPHQRFL